MKKLIFALTLSILSVSTVFAQSAITGANDNLSTDPLYSNGYLDLPPKLRIDNDVDNQVIRYFIDFNCMFCASIKDVMANWAVTLPENYTFVYHHVALEDDNRYYIKASALTFVMNSDIPYSKKQRFIEHMFNHVGKAPTEAMMTRLVKEATADVGLDWNEISAYVLSDASVDHYVAQAMIQSKVQLQFTPSVLIGGRFLTHLGLTDGKPENWTMLLNAVTSAHYYLQHDAASAAK